jgi:hypothetical protein
LRSTAVGGSTRIHDYGRVATPRWRGGLRHRSSRIEDGFGRGGISSCWCVYRVGVALKKVVRRLTTPVEELDRQKLREYCDLLGVTPTTEIKPRSNVRIGGEVRSVRIVPRAGAPALEVTITDGIGNATAVFLGRRKIAGMTPGRHLVIEGVAGKQGNRYLVYNPFYTLLP